MAIFPPLNPTDFTNKYPQYAGIPSSTLQNLWIGVEINTPPFIGQYSQNTANHYWYVVLAHYCELWQTNQAGRVTSATQGDTTTTLENLGSPNLMWWSSTNWGSEIAQMIRMRGGAFYSP